MWHTGRQLDDFDISYHPALTSVRQAAPKQGKQPDGMPGYSLDIACTHLVVIIVPRFRRKQTFSSTTCKCVFSIAMTGLSLRLLFIVPTIYLFSS
jgi:hypothetical protein